MKTSFMLSRSAIIISLAVSVLSVAGVITLAGALAYSAPDVSPTTEQTQGRAIYQPLYSNVVGNVVDNSHPLTTQAQNKQGILNATQFFDAANPTLVIDPSNFSVLGGVLCMGNGQGTNSSDVCGTGAQELNKIINVQDPVDPQDAATKAYVDSKF